MLKLTDIKLYAKNAKLHPADQVLLIIGSIKRFGWRQPIIVNHENGTIVAGHGRFIGWSQAKDELEEAGRGKEPWVIDDKGVTLFGAPETTPFTPDEEMAFRMADNQINARSGQDLVLVKEDLIILRDNGFDTSIIGYDPDILIEDESKDDEVPEAPLEPKTKLGDTYQLGQHTITCGDSTSEVMWSLLMGEQKADMIFTDPPYNVNYKGRGEDTSRTILNDNMEAEQFDTFLDAFFARMAYHTKDGAGWYVFHSTSTQAQFERAMKKAGLSIKNQLIWNKPTASMGWGDYRWKHEPFFYASKEKCETAFYGDRTNSTILDFHKSEEKLIKLIKQIKKAEAEGKTTIWTMKRDKVNEYVHPTQKPVELITYAIINSSKQGDLVVDPFGGSGSTLIACEKTNRVYKGFELDPTFMDVIVQRYVNFTGNGEVIKNGTPETWEPTVYENGN